MILFSTQVSNERAAVAEEGDGLGVRPQVEGMSGLAVVGKSEAGDSLGEEVAQTHAGYRRPLGELWVSGVSSPGSQNRTAAVRPDSIT